MLKKTIIAFILSFLFFIFLYILIEWVFINDPFDGTILLYILFYGIILIIPLGFCCLLAFNYFNLWLINILKATNRHLVYFVTGSIILFLTILLFILYDLSDNDKRFSDSFIEIFKSEYLGFFLFGLILIFVNWIIVWRKAGEHLKL
jgi:hypothetical protein